jgi:hypothetical protein
MTCDRRAAYASYLARTAHKRTTTVNNYIITFLALNEHNVECMYSHRRVTLAVSLHDARLAPRLPLDWLASTTRTTTMT